MEHRILYHDPAVYAAWPALVRAANGDLLLTFTRTEQHIAPDGHLALMRSRDQGRTWSPPQTIYDTPLDDRENGLTVGPHGELLLHIWSTCWERRAYSALPPESYPRATVERWMNHVDSAAYRAAEPLQGRWIAISRDHGETWGPVSPGPDSVHGGVTLQDGSIMVAAYRLDQAVGLYRAPSAEGPWQRIATFVSPRPELRFGEPHLAQLPGGRIVVMIRASGVPYHDEREDLFLWSTHSDDNGASWSPPTPTPLLGYPPHLTVLQDGRLLATYGYRRFPYGERAAISRDGITWREQDLVILRDDAPNLDLGYPASIEVSPGEILTVYYQKPAWDPGDKHRHTVAIMSTRWTVPA